MTSLHQQAEIIANRYQIITTLGQGGMGTTYAAINLETSQRVAIKVVSLREASDWKILELFEREAKTLASLNHPFIPNYLDYFELDSQDDKRFYLVQELVEGESLAELVKQGWHATEEQIRDIAVQILDILIYLHSITPPVIHRDIKPQNILRRDDGQVYLVDFGAVQAVYRNTISIGGTFVGTLGYMSPEQLRGNVVPASDLYSLGCSLIFLLTHRNPNELPQQRMKIDFTSKVNVSPYFANWLNKLLEPNVDNRYQSAEEALWGGSSINSDIPKVHQPIDTKINIQKDRQNLRIEIPSNSFGCFPILGIICSIVWSFGWGLGLLQGDFVAGLACFIGIIMLYFSFLGLQYENKKKTYLIINNNKFRLQWTDFGLMGSVEKYIWGNISEIDFVNLNVDIDKSKDKNGKTTTLIINSCAITIDEEVFKFGDGYDLTEEEANYLVKEISAFIK
ncbi:serine/threonine-protein kinase [Pleurocapsa sp. PCC 7319]|uniref:serine/threonine protein kinase n=1 Tax=Pleurocapsa sp. PCC 7319 TaxID=118161 RepID=UPI000344FFB7|nr:serine/threonine-protein kinase [Pleurocapsa sp. PCC 7319]